MSLLVPQPRITRNLVPGFTRPCTARRPGTVAARADVGCDFYLRLPAGSQAPGGAPPQYVQFAKAACPPTMAATLPAPALRTAAPAEESHRVAPPFFATLGAMQFIGLASAVGAVFGGQAGTEAARGHRKHDDVAGEVALALPGALMGGITGLALAGRVLAALLPDVVHFS